MRPVTQSRPCPYSTSCFECPCKDCKIPIQQAVTANRLKNELKPDARRDKYA